MQVNEFPTRLSESDVHTPLIECMAGYIIQHMDGVTTSSPTIDVTCDVDATLGYAEYNLIATQATCEPCTPVENAALDAAYTCTSLNDSRVTACAEGYARLIGGEGESDSCVEDNWTGCAELIDAIQDDRAVCTTASDFRLPSCAGAPGDCNNVEKIASLARNLTTEYIPQCAAQYAALAAADDLANFTEYLQAEIRAPLLEVYPNGCEEGRTDEFIDLYNCISLVDGLNHTRPCSTPGYSAPVFRSPPPYSCSASCARTWEQVAENCGATLNASIASSDKLTTIAETCGAELASPGWPGTYDSPRVFQDVIVPLGLRVTSPHPALPADALLHLPAAAYLAQLLLRFGSSVVLTSISNTSEAPAYLSPQRTSLTRVGLSVEVLDDATVQSTAMELSDSSVHGADVLAIRPEFRSLPSALGLWRPGDQTDPEVVQASQGLFCASDTVEQSVTQCDGMGGDICFYACSPGHVKSGAHVCNGNFSSPEAGVFEGGACEVELSLAPSVRTTMSLGNLNSSTCATPVNGTMPCGKAAIQAMLGEQFGPSSEVVNFQQEATFELAVPLSVEEFNETTPEGRAALYKVK
jgi:hypothetical protein